MPFFKSLGFAVLLITLLVAMPDVFGALEDTFVIALETLQDVLITARQMASVGQPLVSGLE